MTLREVAAEFWPRYADAETPEDKAKVLEDWDRAIAEAEPEPPPPDELQAAIERATASWERTQGRRRGAV